MPGKLHFRSMFIKLALVSFSFLMGVILLEVFLHVSGIQPDFFAQLDPEVSATYIPGKKGWNVFPSGRQWIEINSYGYRDHEWAVEKAPETTRIALLGDSYVAAMEVPEEQRLSELLEERLNVECGGGRRFEILNFAITGYGTAQELDTMKHRVPRFQPDAVFAFFYTGNDLFNNSLEIDPEPNRVHYQLESSGELVRLSYTIRDNAVKRWLRAHSKSYLFVRDRVKRLSALHRVMMRMGVMQQTGNGEESEGTEEKKGLSPTERLRQMQHLRESPPEIERAWKLTEALLIALEQQASEVVNHFSVIIIPTRNELSDAAGTLSVDEIEKWDMQQPIRRVLEICDRNGFDCLSLVEGMSADASRIDNLFFFPGGHWTPMGHQIAADVVSDWARARFCEPSGDEIR